MRLAEIGLTSRGAGADNIRNITGSPTAGHRSAGADRHAAARTRAASLHPAPSRALRPAAQVQHRLRRRRTRRGAGGHQRHRVHRGAGGGRVRRSGRRVLPPGTRRHHRPPRLRPRHRCDRAARGARRASPRRSLRVFIAEGDRTDRTKARLKYVLDRWGVPRFLEAMEEIPRRAAARASIRPRSAAPAAGQARPCRRASRRSSQASTTSASSCRGAACPAAHDARPCRDRRTLRLRHAAADRLAEPADQRHSRRRRSTTRWPRSRRLGSIGAPRRCAAGWSPAPATPAASSPPATPSATPPNWSIGSDARIAIDRPVNIHLTGCHNSCAQHYVADIGLLATKVEQGDEMVEGYDLLVGGGAGAHQALGRLIRPKRAVRRSAADGAVVALRLDGSARWSRGLPDLDRAPERRGTRHYRPPPLAGGGGGRGSREETGNSVGAVPA